MNDGAKGNLHRELVNDHVAEASDVAYRELMAKAQTQAAAMQETMFREARSIKNFTEMKKRQTGEASSVVTTSTGYADNEMYKTINTGKNAHINVKHCMHPLSPDECDIYSSLTEGHESCITAMPNHCINAHGDAEGFKFQCKQTELAKRMPICREMFFRHSMAECITNDALHPTTEEENTQALSMLLRQKHVLKKLVSIIQRINLESTGKEANFECMPENEDAAMSTRGTTNTNLATFWTQRTTDCRDWKPEMPNMAGIFHAYVKNSKQSTRVHKLFIVVTGGCTMAAERFFNLAIDVDKHVTCKELVDSEESWYLDNINKRNNARIIHAIANEFKLNIPTMLDTHSYHEKKHMAACCTETMIHSIYKDQRTNSVTVTNCCTDTRAAGNGIICSMHPSEGMWLFKGPTVTNNDIFSYGGTFGHDESVGPSAFPTTTPSINDNYSFNCKPPAESTTYKSRIPTSKTSDTSVVARLDGRGQLLPPRVDNPHVRPDESYIRKLASLQWDRNNGMVELIPIAVVVVEKES